MSKYFFLAVFVFGAFIGQAQIFSGMTEIERSKKEGFFTYLATEEKYAIESWKNYLKKFGRVENGKGGAINSYDTRITSISKNSFPLLSKISEENNKTKLFVSIALGPDDYIQTGHAQFKEATAWLEDFIEILNLEEAVRKEEQKLANLTSQKVKNTKSAERLVRELEANKKQTELLTKKLEEAKLEKEKLLANQEQNKLDQKATEDALILQNQAVESAKKKIKD
ncbi:hypothetical protein V7S77_07420 [Aquirufa ecclesiirivi]|uniref:Uncharacterized protein n=1 Tax=Aquirufa ecclesiirivi TaxID=2715124 RepID=A0ABT4JCY0_9BACT|nr:hypothetical protein [Aquirufa ecclesiirivi]MCZ2472354.1 hypothetical protein [Aquirufa ecclesiirivi]MCZ2473967.1 hypothetical protein [Aquirufa ecclesiirivi]MDF0694063.1 hypothetical protein [Aquirufa ecclesiirivi]